MRSARYTARWQSLLTETRQVTSPLTRPSWNGYGRSGAVERTAVSVLAALFEQLSIQWALIGALAANRYRASPRLTQDVDVMLANTGPGLDVLESRLAGEGWMVRRADPAGELLRLRHSELGPVDILISGTDYQQLAIRRARPERIDAGDVLVPVLTVEDVIVHKLIAGRFQDLADIESILASGPVLDAEYVQRWAEFWEVSDHWATLQQRGADSAR